MPVCTRCHSITCNGKCNYLSFGTCKTCGKFSCKGNCSYPFKNKPPSAFLRCALCGTEYMYFHLPMECYNKSKK